MTLKLDIRKAYNRIEWSFLEQIMRKMGFAEAWIALIMMCIATVSYSFKLNRELVGYVHPKPGNPQADPLSPFLLVLCAKGLSSMFDAWERQGCIIGVKVCKEASSVNHLLFSDDNFILVRSTIEECLQVKLLLKTHEDATGQAINYMKS